MIVEPTTLALLVATSFAAGVIDAIAGGGGLLTLPMLLHAGLPPDLALGTNKGQSAFGSGSALLQFARRGLIDRGRAPWAFAAGFAGALVGVELVLHISRDWLRPVIVVLLAAAATFVATLRPGAAPPVAPPVARARWLAPLIAAVVGCYDGFFGPGTGTFLIVLFVALLADDLLKASANAKVVNFASNLASLLWFAHNGRVLWAVSLPMAAGQLLGGFVGARLAVREGQRVVRGVTLSVVAALILKLGHDVWAAWAAGG